MQECKKNNTCHVYNISKDKATLNKKRKQQTKTKNGALVSLLLAEFNPYIKKQNKTKQHKKLPLCPFVNVIDFCLGERAPSTATHI